MMRHFFTKTTVEVSIYCKKCGKDTIWAVSGGRPQYCRECYGKTEPVVKPAEDTQRSLF